MLRRQRRSTSRSEIEAIVSAPVAWWPLLDEAEQQRLLDLSADMVARVRWEAANGFTMSDEIPVLIAVQASLLLLGLDDDRALDNVGTVIVHRSTVTQRGERSVGGGVLTRDPMALSGQAHHRGPVLISWNAARRSLRRPGLGENVVLHEFAHKLDMLDDFLDGTPPLPDDGARTKWVEVCEMELSRLRRGEPGPLRPYAGTNPAEFFAVATEVFFDRPLALHDDRPELYRVLSEFYGQDPAGRWRSWSVSTTTPSATGR